MGYIFFFLLLVFVNLYLVNLILRRNIAGSKEVAAAPHRTATTTIYTDDYGPKSGEAAGENQRGQRAQRRSKYK